MKAILVLCVMALFGMVGLTCLSAKTPPAPSLTLTYADSVASVTTCQDSSKATVTDVRDDGAQRAILTLAGPGVQAVCFTFYGKITSLNVTKVK